LRLRVWYGCLLAAAVVIGLPSRGLAQSEPTRDAQAISPSSAAAAASAAKNHCVLHVWPSATARSSYTGWFHGGAVDGDRRGIKGYPAMHGEVLNTVVQQQLLNDIDWPGLLNRPGLSVVVHDEPPAPQDDVGRTTPLIIDRPDCYQELLVHSVFVEGAAFSAKSVRVMIIAKGWQSSDASPKTYSAMANEAVNFDSQDNGVIERSLKNGFVASVRKTLTASYFQKH
jgi:hypothetical protein